ncbi:MAG: hypothetical protein ACK465_04905, partial [Flavobacteriia bacterium]
MNFETKNMKSNVKNTNCYMNLPKSHVHSSTSEFNRSIMNRSVFATSLKNWFVGVVAVAILLLGGVSKSFAQSATTVTVGGTSTVNSIQNATATFVDPGLTISSNGNITGFRVMITGSYTSGDILDYSGTLPSGITAVPFSTVTKSIVFNGTTSASNWQTFLRTVRLKTTTVTCFPESRQVAFIAGGSLYNPLNNHFYTMSPSSTAWTDGV